MTHTDADLDTAISVAGVTLEHARKFGDIDQYREAWTHMQSLLEQRERLIADRVAAEAEGRI